jgi:hypothetical protein
MYPWRIYKYIKCGDSAALELCRDISSTRTRLTNDQVYVVLRPSRPPSVYNSRSCEPVVAHTRQCIAAGTKKEREGERVEGKVGAKERESERE